MKRTLSIILTICLMMSILPTSIFSIAASASEVSVPISATKTGTCGDSARWVYYEETGELKIFGSGAITGELYPAGDMKNPPWSSFGADVKSISVANDITSIPEGAFRSCTNLESLSVPFIGKSRTANEGYDQVLGYVFGCTSSNVTGTTLQYQKYVYNGAIYYYLYIYYYIPATLKEVIITDGTKISGNPFNNCKNIRSVGLSDSIVSISSSVFSSCSRITDVWYEGTEDEKNNISIGSYNSYLTSATWHFDSCIKNSNKITHSFDDCEDASCNNCDRVRRAPGHLYNYCTDTKCSSCDKIRIALKHTYSSCTDKTCNSCPFVRADEHQYQNNCDADCDVCGYIRVPSEHVYSNESDTTCDECGPYDITYHLDGGTNALKNPDVYTLEDNIVLKDATKEGYSFAGWYINEEKTQKITNISNRTGNIDLYAKFVPYSYAATFIGNGADKLGSVKITLISEETYESKEVYVEGGDSFNPYDYWSPSAPGYVFLGWLYNDVVIDESIEINESSDIQIKAKWKEMTTVAPVLYYSYNLSAEYQSSVSFYTSNDACYITWSAYSQAYYSPHGTKWESSWAISANGSYVDRSYVHPGYRSGSAYIEPGTLVTAYCSMDTGLTSEELDGWLNISYSSKRCNDGEFFVSKNNQIVQQEFNAPINTPSLSKKGYRFVGWYDESGNKMTETWQYTENQTFTAKWEPIKYDISYVLDGGINDASNPVVYTIEDSIMLKDPSKPGYTFKGWYSDSNFTTKVTSISQRTDNIRLYAKWEENSYNLTLDANWGCIAPKVTFLSDGVEIKSYYLREQDSIVAYRPENKNGYIFAGWYKDASCTNLFKFNGTITEDITLYAKWIQCSENVINIESTDSFDIAVNGKSEQLYAFVPLVDGTIVVTSSSDGLDLYGILYGATKNQLITADDISDSDLDFSYTYNVKAGQLYYIAVKGSTASTSGEATISVDWTGSCTIMGTTYPNKQVSIEYDTEYKLPQKPIREGYIFLGWFDETDTQITDGVWNFTTDKTLKAKWEAVEDHNHNYSAWKKHDDDYHVSECVCGEKEFFEHEWGLTDTVPATCVLDGYYFYTCKLCEATQTETIARLGHIEGDWITDKEATCTEEGSKHQICSECGVTIKTETISKKGHKYVSTVTEPTCTKKGYTTHTCHCGNSFVDTYVDARGHTEGEWITDKEATCTEEGSKHQICSECDVTIKTETIGKKGHKYVSTVTEPTCTKKGYTTHTCHCGNSFVDTYVDARGHTEGEWITDKEATLTEEGSKHQICSECGVTIKTEAIPKKEVITGECGEKLTWTLDSSTWILTISGNGAMYEFDSSSRPWFSCRKSLKKIIIEDGVTSISENAFLGCDSLTSVTVGSSVSSIGVNSFYGCTKLTDITLPNSVISIKAMAFMYCSSLTSISIPNSVIYLGFDVFARCDKLASVTIQSKTLSIPYGKEFFSDATIYGYAGSPAEAYAIENGKTFVALDEHEWELTGTVPATCVSDGYYLYTCRLCETTKTETITKLGHVESDWIIDKDSTCAEEGSRHQACSVCGVTIKIATINKKAHSHVSTVIEPTCTEKGYTTHTCSLCGDSYTDSEVAELGHTAGAEADCLNDQTCTVCGTVLVEKLVHDYDAVITDPTCSEKGYTTHTCHLCGDSYVDTYVDALAHTEGEWTIDKEPTIKEEGQKHQTCSVCGETMRTEIIPRLTVLPGDVDGNESVDKNDAIYLLMHSFFPEDYPINQEADYNGNGMVDKDDAIHLLMYTFFPDDYPLSPAPASVALTTGERKKENEE